MRYHAFRAMSTEILTGAEGPVEKVEEGFRQAEDYIAACEKRFTRFSEDSELSALNRSAGSWFEASGEMFELVALAVRMYQQTQGLFDPAILGALERAGYDRTIDEVRAGSSPRVQGPTTQTVLAQLTGRVGESGFAGVRLDEAGRRIWLPEGVRIDLGGIAKGWIAEQAARRLAGWSSACAVDAGGDAFFIGLPVGEKYWRVALEDPTEPGSSLAVLNVPPGAVATSAITKRKWQQNGKTYHHLIDPRTQLPAETDWLSVTTIAPHAAQAEVFAKCLLIGGSFEANRTAAFYPGIEFIAVDQNKKLWGSKYSRELIDVSA